jgi:hypothetical protein
MASSAKPTEPGQGTAAGGLRRRRPGRRRVALDRFYRWCDGVQLLELTRLARTVRAWQTGILAWHRTAGCSNGPTEAINLLIKKVKRVGHGFRNFANYRLRLLLHCGVRCRRTNPQGCEATHHVWWRRAALGLAAESPAQDGAKSGAV